MNMKRELLEREMVSQPVRSLQHMLSRLSKRHTFLPEIIPDGRFGEQTLEAVMLLQKFFRLPVTGTVDQRTWRAIREAWLEAERDLLQPDPVRAFPTGRVVREGDSDGFLYPVQAMFQSLSEVLEGVEAEELDGIHRGSSVKNTRWLQRKAQLAETGEIDARTWQALAALYEMMVISNWERQKDRRKWALPGRG